jgi:signal transduction histidine kinase
VRHTVIVIVRRFTDRPIVQKILIANAIVILIGAVGGTYLTRRLAEQSSVALTAFFVLCGLAITIVANWLVLRATFRPLVEISRAMESIHKGELHRRVAVDSADPMLRSVSNSFNEMLVRLEGESRRYSARLFDSIEEERRRIGRELHDETNQTHAAPLINLELTEKALADCGSPDIRERVANSKRLISHSMEQIKLLVYDLRPVMLDDFGLVPALRWYIQSHLEGAGPTIVTDFDEAGPRLPGDVETALYRIAQDALTNAVRHAQASKIVVRLETKPGFASLAVIDNGTGFDPGEAMYRGDHRGLGLLSVKERVELLDGTVNIESTLGRGTRVYVVIPLARERRS